VPSRLSTRVTPFSRSSALIASAIAKSFAFLAAALAGFFMTVDYSRKIEDGKKVSIAFKVCSLIFINMIAGILMLIDNPEKVQPTVETETAVSEFDQQMLELKKLKKLLDMGILTQEEFDEKKKQILGL
jgi:hypothetical protein